MKRFLATDAPSSNAPEPMIPIDPTPALPSFVQRKLHPERQPVTADELHYLLDKEASSSQVDSELSGDEIVLTRLSNTEESLPTNTNNQTSLSNSSIVKPITERTQSRDGSDSNNLN